MGILNRLFGGKMNEPGEERTEKHPAEPQIRPVPEEETVTEKEPQEIIRVYEGYYFSYDFVSNGWGGYHPVNLTFNHDEKGLHKQITDGTGWFLDFPGVVEGPWRQDLEHPFREQIEFVFNTGRPSDESDLLNFYWTVQPDGRYYADEDGFGMEDDEEIVLVTGMDRQGRFTGPFHERK